MKALLLATTAPDGSSPQQTGSTNWILRLTKTLHRLHDVTLVTPPPIHEPWLGDSGIPILEHPVQTTGSRIHRFVKSLAQGIYPSIWTLYSGETTDYLRNLSKGAFDVCWILDDYGGIYLRDIPPHLPTVFVRHYLFSMQKSFYANGGGIKERIRGWHHQHTAFAFDRWTTRCANIVTLGTPDSCKFLQNTFPDNQVEYLPTKPCSLPRPTSHEKLQKPRGPDGRLIAAYLADMSFIRNAEGATWFIEKVLPAIPEAVRRQYHFQFIGREPDPNPELGSLPVGSSVEFMGFVDDLTAALHMAQAAFIPVFGGNGVRLKTLTLLGAGLPTVSTPDALEGLDAIHGHTVLEATSADEFADAFEQLLDADLRQQLSQNSLQIMEKFLDEEEDAEKALAFSKMIANKK